MPKSTPYGVAHARKVFNLAAPCALSGADFGTFPRRPQLSVQLFRELTTQDTREPLIKPRWSGVVSLVARETLIHDGALLGRQRAIQRLERGVGFLHVGLALFHERGALIEALGQS